MNIFLTGGTGFIGSYLTNLLLREGHNLTILTRNSSKAQFYNQKAVTFLDGSLTDRDVIQKALPGHDALIHNALNWGVTPLEMAEKDTLSSVFLFEAAANAGIKKVVYTSSATAVGVLRPVMREDTRLIPDCSYSASKAASEAWLHAVASQYGLMASIVRPGYVFGNPIYSGSNMQPDGRFREIVRKICRNEDVCLIKNDGTQFIWAGDLAGVYLQLLKVHKGLQVYQAMSQEYFTWQEIAEYAINYLKSSSRIVLEDLGWTKGGCIYDVSALRKGLGIEVFPRDRIEEHVRFLIDVERNGYMKGPV